MTTPRRPDNGWRKAAIVGVGIVATAGLGIAGTISGEVAIVAIGGLVASYLGVNTAARRAGR